MHRGLARRWVAAAGGVFEARHHLIVDTWAWAQISRFLQKRVAAVGKSDWDGIAVKLARLGAWEFEDYRPT